MNKRTLTNIEAAHIILQNITSKSGQAPLYIDLKCGFRGNKAKRFKRNLSNMFQISHK